jgi:VWFA-related protein
MKKSYLVQMAGRFNKTPSYIRVQLLLGSVLLSLMLCGQLVMPGIAQNRSRKPRKPVSSQSQKPAAKPAPSPTPSIFDLLGEPPPSVPRPTPVPTPEQDINPGDVISIETTEVMLPVSVRDANGRLVTQLTRDDFRVFEDDQQQPLRDLALRQVPVDAVLMIDGSSSTARNLEDFRKAAEAFAARLAADDRISLIQFDDTVRLLQDWTRSRYQLRRALMRITPGMFTRFHDALVLAAKDQYGDSSSRRAVIVFTDGIDSGRGASLESAARALLEAQVTVYVVSNTEISRAAKLADLDSLTEGSQSTQRFNKLQIDDLRLGLQALDQSEEILEKLTSATGGKLYKPASFDALESTYAEVAEELRHQYALYYTPLNKKREGDFRRVRVETTNPTHQTRTRRGYFAPRS